MQRIALSYMVCLALASGCAWSGNKSSCGWHFEVIKPPLITTENQVLVQTGSPIHSAQPMGNFSGPLIEGQALYGTPYPVAAPVPQFRSQLRLPSLQAQRPCVPDEATPYDGQGALRDGKRPADRPAIRPAPLPMPREDCPQPAAELRKKEE